MKKEEISWGRNRRPDRKTRWVTTMLFLGSPGLVLWFYLLNYHYNASPGQFFQTVSWEKLGTQLPSWNLSVGAVLLGWFCFQWFLAYLPDFLTGRIPRYVGGIQPGPPTPAGHQIFYQINGLQAWGITHLLFGLGWIWGGWDPAWIAKHWGEIFLWANLWGYLWTAFAYFKAYFFPTYPKDNTWSGHRIYDAMMGVEFNPRLLGLDLKLFFNGRPGIVAWTLINLSFAAWQKEQWGFVSDSMGVLLVLQGLYVLDFFWNERWYLKTLDMAHEHFGFYLAWGDCVWLPFMYTLQAVYLCFHPVILGPIYSGLLLGVGFLGYLLFRTANAQKDRFRQGAKGDPSERILFEKTEDEPSRRSHRWVSKPLPRTIPCTYETEDGVRRSSVLLCGGCWGKARHLNYTGDLLLAWTWGAVCGWNSPIPHFYSMYMFLLLLTRTFRDEARCAAKYGEAWKEYVCRVPSRWIPGIL